MTKPKFKNENQERLAKPSVLAKYLREATVKDCKALIREELKKKAEARMEVIKKIQVRISKARAEEDLQTYASKIEEYKKAS